MQGEPAGPIQVPSGTGPGVPLGTRTAPTGCFAGLFSDKRDARGYSWSSSVRGTSADHLDFGSGSIRPQNSDGGRTSGLPLRCLQEHPESVLLGFSPPNLEPGLRAKKRVSHFGLPHPVEPQPSRGESISFLSPARAAEAPTFCDATESRQRTHPRGLPPPWPSPPTGQRITNRENSALRPPP